MAYGIADSHWLSGSHIAGEIGPFRRELRRLALAAMVAVARRAAIEPAWAATTIEQLQTVGVGLPPYLASAVDMAPLPRPQTDPIYESLSRIAELTARLHGEVVIDVQDIAAGVIRLDGEAREIWRAAKCAAARCPLSQPGGSLKNVAFAENPFMLALAAVCLTAAVYQLTLDSRHPALLADQFAVISSGEFSTDDIDDIFAI